MKKKSNKKKIIIIIAVIVLIIVGYCIYVFKDEDSKYLIHMINFGSNDILATDYYIYYKEDGNIVVKEIKTKDGDHISSIRKYKIKFSEKNMKLLREYIEKYHEHYTIEHMHTRLMDLKKDSQKIFSSIIYKDDSYLEGIEEIPEILYTVTYGNPTESCFYKYLEILSDNSFNFVLAKKGEGIFSFGSKEYENFERILSNPNSDASDILIKDVKTNQYIPFNQEKLDEFLNSIDMTLDSLKSDCEN